MKFIRYILLFIVLLPLSTFALEEVIIKCPEHINKNEDFECDVMGNASYKVSALEYEFKLPDYIEKKQFIVDPSWEGTEEDNLVILYTDENKESPFKIGVITLNSNKKVDYVDISTEYLLFGDDEYNAYVIKERENVKEMESSKKKVDNEKNNNFLYAIIILITIGICLIAYIFIKKRVRR